MNQNLRSIAYLGSPYSDPEPSVRNFRLRAVTQMVFDLRMQNILAYSPLTHNIPIDRLGVFGDFQTWLAFDHEMLSRCDKLLVLKLPGWENSKGLAAELNLAKSKNMPIDYIEPTAEFINKISVLQDSNEVISNLNQEIKKLVDERDWHKFHSPKNLAMNVQIEASELAEHFVWLTEEQSYQLEPKQKQAVSEELGDVFISLLQLSEKLGIDLLESTYSKIQKIKLKYPAHLSKGKAIKYTAYETK